MQTRATTTSAPAAVRPRELTPRALVLGAAITLVFTAANVYLGLKVGLTFASSIPAAVISMALLRAAGGSNLLENNIVQTVASAAGTLSSIIFVLPGLVMVGHWHGFPWAETAGICFGGACLGIVFTIPLRRAMVIESGLAFPEGTACAEILEIGAGTASTAGSAAAADGARALAAGSLVSAAVSLATGGLALLAAGATAILPFGAAVFRLGTGFSLALVGAGYLMGIAAGVAILVGFVLAWLVAVPILTAITPNAAHLAPGAFALLVWAHKVRFIGAGIIAVAALSTLANLAPAIARGLSRAAASARLGSAADETDRDLSPAAIAALAVLGAGLILAMTIRFLGPAAWPLALLLTVLATLFGFLVAAACGYMAGLVGSSASPISGIAIVAVVLVSLLLLAIPAGSAPIAVPLALFTTSAILAMATISNDNLQDLKTGAIVGASPRRQQIALVLGTLAGSVVIPPVLVLLYHAYGFAGALPRPHMNPDTALAAPQATLMSAIAGGILGRTLDWTMIGIGIAIGVVLVFADVALRRFTRTLRLPPLPVGIGLYLPASVGSTLFVGALLSLFVSRFLARRPPAARRDADRNGVLLASGLIVGESLIGVLLAAIIGASGRDDAIALTGPGFAPVSVLLGLVVFLAVCAWFLRTVLAAPGGRGFPSATGRV